MRGRRGHNRGVEVQATNTSANAQESRRRNQEELLNEEGHANPITENMDIIGIEELFTNQLEDETITITREEERAMEA